ncbi:MAG: N-acetyl-gamma-glutamyl-phosphate reductase [Actinobacteria bacterium]|nr:N-acetyl-gamma-glutamyl-phosphate reductase [Actinomycetota bacterium]
MKAVGVVGAAGFAGIEVVRFVLGHPDLDLVYAASDSDAGKMLSEIYPSLAGVTAMEFAPCDVSALAEACDIVFLAVPHTASLGLTPTLLEAGVLVIDLSADYRIRDAATYEQWYGAAHTSENLLYDVVYGLPELNREKLEALGEKGAGLVACPGCYPTASSLASIPALKAGVTTSDIVISDCISGVSGAGRKLSRTSSFCAAGENVCAYGVATHRHTPEIAQTLSDAAGHDVKVVFTPHLAPVVRGLLSTVYLCVEPGLTRDMAFDLYRAYYEHEPFVTVLPLGAMPQTKDVVGTNNAHIGLALDGRTNMLIVSCAIDNLDKGAASQAIQCANIVLGFEETRGLQMMYAPVV